MVKVYTKKEIADLLPRIQVGNANFILSGASTKTITSPIEIGYVTAGDKMVKTEKRVPRTISVNNAEFVLGNPYSIEVGSIVEVEGISCVVQSISTKGFSVKEILPTGTL